MKKKNKILKLILYQQKIKMNLNTQIIIIIKIQTLNKYKQILTFLIKIHKDLIS